MFWSTNDHLSTWQPSYLPVVHQVSPSSPSCSSSCLSSSSSSLAQTCLPLDNRQEYRSITTWFLKINKNLTGMSALSSHTSSVLIATLARNLEASASVKS
jgi:hypothetical protein